MRQLMKCLITLWVTLSVSMGSNGITGNDMKDKCGNDVNPYSSGFCSGFIVGATGMDSLRQLMNDNPLICEPDRVTNGQKRSIVIKYMKEHPEELHRPFLAITVNSLMEAFPCEE